MRTILHVDMNSYFASVEQAANPYLKGKPIAVGGGTGSKTTIVAACSYEAKARGVKTAMPAWEAKKICPELIIVAGDMNKYIYTSSQIMKMFRRFTPLVQVFSIDEAFLDITDTKERFGGEIKIAREIKKWIRERFHITCSIGIGYNKLIAKLAGELKKPDGITILRPEDIPDKIRDLKVSKLCGIGSKIEEHLNRIGIKTFYELHKASRLSLVREFGIVYGEQLYFMGQGIDHSPVMPHTYHEDAKSMGHAYTMPKATTDLDEVKSYLLRLSEQVGRRLRRDKYKGNVVHLTVGFGNFKFWSKQKKIEDYIDDGYELFKYAEKLLLLNPENDAYRFVGVSLSNLLKDADQVSLIESWERDKKILAAIDKINDRYGEFVVERLSLLNTVLNGKVGMVSSISYTPYE